MQIINVTTKQPGEQLATHEEMTTFCLRHGQMVIPQKFEEAEVPTLDEHVQALIRLARQDETLDDFNRRRLIASFQTTRRMFTQARKRQSRRAAKVTITEE